MMFDNMIILFPNSKSAFKLPRLAEKLMSLSRIVPKMWPPTA
jgi:hypothetical protein